MEKLSQKQNRKNSKLSKERGKEIRGNSDRDTSDESNNFSNFNNNLVKRIHDSTDIGKKRKIAQISQDQDYSKKKVTENQYIDIYKPTKMAELGVHKAKLKEFTNFMEQAQK